MADVTIKYKGNSIATMDDSGTKTLNTSGKYCEDNFTIEYVARETGLADVKRWDITSTGDVSSSIVRLVTDDWLKEHGADDNLVVMVIPKFAVPYTSGNGNQGMYLCTNAGRATDSSGNLYKSMSLYVHSGGSIVARGRTQGLTNGNNIGDLWINSYGSLYAYVGTTYPLVAGEYMVMAFLM